MHILVVDDDAMTITFLTDILAEMGHEVATAHDGEDALNTLHATKVDLVISDIRMPRMGGIALLGRIAEHSDPPEVVFLTAYAELETALQALNLGAADYLHKPITAAELSARIGRIAERQTLKAELETARIEQARAETARQMVVTLSHELNNPMTSILGNLRVLKQATMQRREIADAIHLYDCIERNLERMQQVMHRLRHIEQVQSTEYLPGTRMVDPATSRYTPYPEGPDTP